MSPFMTWMWPMLDLRYLTRETKSVQKTVFSLRMGTRLTQGHVGKGWEAVRMGNAAGCGFCSLHWKHATIEKTVGSTLKPIFSPFSCSSWPQNQLHKRSGSNLLAQSLCICSWNSWQQEYISQPHRHIGRCSSSHPASSFLVSEGIAKGPQKTIKNENMNNGQKEKRIAASEKGGKAKEVQEWAIGEKSVRA